MPAIFTTVTAPDGYQILSNSITDAGTYPLKLSMTLLSYPGIFTPYEYASLTWTVTVLDTCLTTALSAFTSPFVTMTETVMGGYQYEEFSHPIDTLSTANDVTLSYYSVPTPYTSSSGISSTKSGPFKGMDICGPRQYTVTPAATCGVYLTVGIYSGIFFPYLRLHPTLAS